MQYQLRVLRDGQLPYRFELDAESVLEARKLAESQGLTVLNVQLQQSTFSLKSFNQTKDFPLILFCQEFRVLFEAGLSVLDVIETLIAKEMYANNKRILQSLFNAVSEGKTLSQAFVLQANVFPSLFTATISAAETTGEDNLKTVRLIFAAYDSAAQDAVVKL